MKSKDHQDILSNRQSGAVEPISLVVLGVIVASMVLGIQAVVNLRQSFEDRSRAANGDLCRANGGTCVLNNWICDYTLSAFNDCNSGYKCGVNCHAPGTNPTPTPTPPPVPSPVPGDDCRGITPGANCVPNSYYCANDLGRQDCSIGWKCGVNCHLPSCPYSCVGSSVCTANGGTIRSEYWCSSGVCCQFPPAATPSPTPRYNCDRLIYQCEQDPNGSYLTYSACTAACVRPTPTATPRATPSPSPNCTSLTNGVCLPDGEDCNQRRTDAICPAGRFCCVDPPAPSPTIYPTPSPGDLCREITLYNGDCFPNGYTCTSTYGQQDCPSNKPICGIGCTPRPTPSPSPCPGTCIPDGEDCYQPASSNFNCGSHMVCCLIITRPTPTASPRPTPTRSPSPTPSRSPSPSPTPCPTATTGYVCTTSNLCTANDGTVRTGYSCPAGVVCCQFPPQPTATPTPPPHYLCNVSYQCVVNSAGPFDSYDECRINCRAPTPSPSRSPAPTPACTSSTVNGTCLPNGEDCQQVGNGTCNTGFFCCVRFPASPSPRLPSPTPSPGELCVEITGGQGRCYANNYVCAQFFGQQDCPANQPRCGINCSPQPTPTPPASPSATPRSSLACKYCEDQVCKTRTTACIPDANECESNIQCIKPSPSPDTSRPCTSITVGGTCTSAAICLIEAGQVLTNPGCTGFNICCKFPAQPTPSPSVHVSTCQQLANTNCRSETECEESGRTVLPNPGCTGSDVCCYTPPVGGASIPPHMCEPECTTSQECISKYQNSSYYCKISSNGCTNTCQSITTTVPIVCDPKKYAYPASSGTSSTTYSPETSCSSSGTILKVCNHDGTAWNYYICPSGTTCLDNKCSVDNALSSKPPQILICQPGKTKCDDADPTRASLLTCNEQGSWDKQFCGYGNTCVYSESAGAKCIDLYSDTQTIIDLSYVGQNDPFDLLDDLAWFNLINAQYEQCQEGEKDCDQIITAASPTGDTCVLFNMLQDPIGLTAYYWQEVCANQRQQTMLMAGSTLAVPVLGSAIATSPEWISLLSTNLYSQATALLATHSTLATAIEVGGVGLGLYGAYQGFSSCQSDPNSTECASLIASYQLGLLDILAQQTGSVVSKGKNYLQSQIQSQFDDLFGNYLYVAQPLKQINDLETLLVNSFPENVYFSVSANDIYDYLDDDTIFAIQYAANKDPNISIFLESSLNRGILGSARIINEDLQFIDRYGKVFSASPSNPQRIILLAVRSNKQLGAGTPIHEILHHHLGHVPGYQSVIEIMPEGLYDIVDIELMRTFGEIETEVLTQLELLSLGKQIPPASEAYLKEYIDNHVRMMQEIGIIQ